MSNEKSHGLRYNSGKLRFDLVHPLGLEGMVKVLTMGSEKYEPRNWEKGMSWSSVIASLKRHLNAIEKGEDFDTESGLLHIDHIQCNAHFLSSYYKIAPQFDDRNHWWMKPFKKVYLDLDGVCVDFDDHFISYFNLPKTETIDWNDYRFSDNIHRVDDKFWLSCPPLIDPKDLIYPIAGYCTARSNCTTDTINTWLKNNNFPKGEIINVGKGGSKVEALKNKCDAFLDDSINNFVELNSNGINCFLKTRNHNLKYNVGHKRVLDINEFFIKVYENN